MITVLASIGLLAAAGNFGLSFILEVIGTVLVALFIVRYVVPPLRRMMTRRLETIRASLEAGERAREAAAELVAEKRAALEEAKTEAQHIVDQARRGAENLVAEGHRNSEEEYERALHRAQSEIEASQARLRSEILDETGALVVDAAERVVNAVLDGPRHHRLIDEAIGATDAGAGA